MGYNLREHASTANRNCLKKSTKRLLVNMIICKEYSNSFFLRSTLLITGSINNTQLNFQYKKVQFYFYKLNQIFNEDRFYNR